jgi:hypothetical protein
MRRTLATALVLAAASAQSAHAGAPPTILPGGARAAGAAADRATWIVGDRKSVV